MAHVFRWMTSPVGPLKLVGSDKGLAAVLWEDDHRRYRHLADLRDDADHPFLAEAQQQLRAYFAGQRKVFSLRLDVEGTVFETSVWAALRAIPYGEIRSYGEIARAIGQPRAIRAVGRANGRNPLSIIVPCHRVIAASGALTGFAGGLKAKSSLLAIEGVRASAAETKQAVADLWSVLA